MNSRSVRIPAARAYGAVYGIPILTIMAMVVVIVLAISAGWGPLVTLAGVVVVCSLIVLFSPVIWDRDAPSVAVDLDAETDLATVVTQALQDAGAANQAKVSVTLGYLVEHDRESQTLRIGLPWLAGTRSHLRTACTYAAALSSHGHRGSLDLAARVRVVRAAVLADSVMLRWPLTPYVRLCERELEKLDLVRHAAARQRCVERLGEPATASHEAIAELHKQFLDYWASEVGPCIEAGFCVPLLDGWAIAGSSDLGLEDAAPDDHVSLDRPALEAALLTEQLGHPETPLVPLDWNDVGHAVWLPMLTEQLATSGDGPGPFRIADVATQASGPVPAGALAEALVVALVGHGAALTALPGEPIRVFGEEWSLAPFGLCQSAADGDFDEPGWHAFLAESGLEDVTYEPITVAASGGAAECKSLPIRVQDRTLALAWPPNRRRRLVLGCIELLLLLAMAAGSIALTTSNPMTHGGRIFLWVLGCVLVVVAGFRFATNAAPLLTQGTLDVTEAGLLLNHPGLLREPFHVPRSSIRTVVVDNGAWSDFRRFPAAGAGDLVTSDDVACLWEHGFEAGPIPLLGIGTEVPNVAVIAQDPTLVPKVRVRRKTGPLRGEAFAGLMFECADADAAREALSPWGAESRLGPEDIRHINAYYTGQ